MFEKVLERISKLLDDNKISYMIIGGQAVLVYGEPRFTRDIDITLGVGPEKLAFLEKALAKSGIKPIPSVTKDFVEKTMVLPCEDKDTKIRIDFIFSFTEYEKQAIVRGRKMRIGSSSVNFASVEDVIIHKIFAGRPRDIEDAKNILLKNPSIDTKYVKKWLEVFDESFPEKRFPKEFDKLNL